MPIEMLSRSTTNSEGRSELRVYLSGVDADNLPDTVSYNGGALTCEARRFWFSWGGVRHRSLAYVIYTARPAEKKEPT